MAKARQHYLGAPRAEQDVRLLRQTFIETTDFKTLTETADCNFVVGRRGTGKSALFLMVSRAFQSRDRTHLITESPQEHEVLELQGVLEDLSVDYRVGRAACRVAWLLQLGMTCVGDLLANRHYLGDRYPEAEIRFLEDYKARHDSIMNQRGMSRTVELVRSCLDAIKGDPKLLPGELARTFQKDKLIDSVKAVLQQTKQNYVVIYDGLDEGWEPTGLAASIVGGLAIASADLTDRQAEIHAILFIRDNIFRALAQFDPDYSRHIEGNTLRLHWTEGALLNLVGERIRAVRELGTIGNVKAWNRFAHREIKGLDGFRSCLKHTLYRPRDVLVLLNAAHAHAAKEGRDEIVQEDIDATAVQISQDRLEDLLKEYRSVLPGLRGFIETFRNGPTRYSFGEALSVLNRGTETLDVSDSPREFALFESGREIFNVLHSVGFLGVHDPATDHYAFCHDGSNSDLSSIEMSRMLVVHPCYWKALDLSQDSEEGQDDTLRIVVHDDYDVPDSEQARDARLRMLGQITGRLPKIPTGKPGWRQFEDWVYSAVRTLFSDHIKNIQQQPNPHGHPTNRDIVGTNMAESGVWKRIREDYDVRQVIFEVKNYVEAKPDDFRQVLSYATGEYGRLVFIVTRSEVEGLTDTEKAHLQTLYHEHKRLVVILPAVLLVRCLRKMRNPDRRVDYTEDQIGRRMDTFVRSYLSIPNVAKYRKKGRK